MNDLPSSAGVAVVGGGILGLSIGAWLARDGADVVLLERGALGAGSSGRSGAIVRSFYHHRLLARSAEACRRDLWSRFDEFFEGPGKVSSFEETGLVFYAPAEEAGSLAEHFAS